MKFEDYAEDITEVLKLPKDTEITFQLFPVTPVELREHIVEEDSFIKVVKCLWNDNKENECPYCITAKTLMKHSGGKNDFKKWYAKKVFFLPAMLKDSEKLYLFRFRSKIHDAYIQLITEANRYKLKGLPLFFTHKVDMKNGFPDYGSCSFTFNTAGAKKKKNFVSIKVNKLCEDKFFNL